MTGVFFISIREKSDQRLFFFCLLDAAIYHFSLFSQTSPYLNWRAFSLNLRASLVPAYYRDKFSFSKKKSIMDCVSLMVICGPKKFQMAPRKSEGGQTWPSKLLTWGQHQAFTEGCTTFQNSKLI